MRKVRVDLGSRTYNIQIGEGNLSGLGKVCRTLKFAARGAIITDSNVGPLYGPAVVESLQQAGFDPVMVTVPAGETSKNLRVVHDCHENLARHRLERKSFIVALGGGVVGDLAGFVAATYLRGIPFVQAPTSLLAQVDSSVGGKVGVNLKAGKNLVGAFYQPRHVLCDLSTFPSLPDREFKAGLAEVVKYGIIYDRPFFARLERDLELLLNRDATLMAKVVARCCQIKADVVGQDETETGLRAILNFGHTIGHGLEAISGYGKLLHGEAIAIGQVAAARLSSRQLGLPENELARIKTIFKRIGLPTSFKLTAKSRGLLLEAMKLDKKVAGGEIKFVLARSIGRVEFGQRVPESVVADIVETLDEQ